MAAAATADAWFLSGARPFTARAELLAAVTLAATGLAAARPLVVERWHPAAPGVPGRSRSRPERAAGAGSLLPWAVALGLLGAWELAAYVAGLGGRRAEFPTLSSLYDGLARWHLARAAVCAAWLALGVALAA